MSTYLFGRFLRRIFSVLRAGKILYIFFYALAWRHRFFFLSKILSAFFTRSLARDSPHLFTTTSVPKLIFFTPISADGRRCHFRLRVQANHYPFLFFLPLSADSLGSLSLSPGHRMQTSVGFHSDPHSLLFPTGREELTYITISLFSGQ